MRRVTRGYLVTVSVLNGFAGMVCGVLILAFPADGGPIQLGALLPVIHRMPLASIFFRDFFWIGVVMLLALGIPNTLAAVMLIRRASGQYIVTLAAAALLCAWCLFELTQMPNPAAVGYLTVGVLGILGSVLLLRVPAVEAA